MAIIATVAIVVFPALAGMNRFGRQTRPPTTGVPRARGDEPELAQDRMDSRHVFPALAGMNR